MHYSGDKITYSPLLVMVALPGGWDETVRFAIDP